MSCLYVTVPHVYTNVCIKLHSHNWVANRSLFFTSCGRGCMAVDLNSLSAEPPIVLASRAEHLFVARVRGIC